MMGPMGTTRKANIYIHNDTAHIYIYVIGTIYMIMI